jgi:hypothetical protein
MEVTMYNLKILGVIAKYKLRGSDQTNAMIMIRRLLIIEPSNATHAGANRNKPVLNIRSLLTESGL